MRAISIKIFKWNNEFVLIEFLKDEKPLLTDSIKLRNAKNTNSMGYSREGNNRDFKDSKSKPCC